MRALVDEKDLARPSHDAIDTDKPTDGDAAPGHRAEQVANKAASRGLERQNQDDADHGIFTK